MTHADEVSGRSRSSATLFRTLLSFFVLRCALALSIGRMKSIWYLVNGERESRHSLIWLVNVEKLSADFFDLSDSSFRAKTKKIRRRTASQDVNV